MFAFLSSSEKITIYYYKSNAMDRTFRGIAVVLNLTGSNCFLRCCKEGDRVLLQVEVKLYGTMYFFDLKMFCFCFGFFHWDLASETHYWSIKVFNFKLPNMI